MLRKPKESYVNRGEKKVFRELQSYTGCCTRHGFPRVLPLVCGFCLQSLPHTGGGADAGPQWGQDEGPDPML